MALSTLCFVGLSTFPGWQEEDDCRIKPFPGRSVVRLCTSASALAFTLMLAAALWQHIAAACAVSVIEAMSQGYVVGHVGIAAAALVWLSFVASAVATVVLCLMARCLAFLDWTGLDF
jgi:hypothetical protein